MVVRALALLSGSEPEFRSRPMAPQQFPSPPNEPFSASSSAFTGFHRAVFDCGRAILVFEAGLIGMGRGFWGKGSG